MTLEEIGKVYGVTRERIRQIESTTLSRIRIRLGLEKPEPRNRRRRSAGDTHAAQPDVVTTIPPWPSKPRPDGALPKSA